MIRRVVAGLVLAVLLAVLCVPAAGQWWPPGEYANHAEHIHLTILQNSYSGTPLPDIYTEDEPPCADDYSLWYWFSTTETTEISIYVMGAAEGDQSGPFTEPRVEVQVGLYQVSEGGLLDVRCETGGADFDVHFVETIAANTTYYLQIGATTTPHSYRLVLAPTLTNDEMTSAQPVTLPFFYNAPHASAASSGDGEFTCADQHSIWFTFTLDRPKLVNVLVYATDFRFPDQVAPRVGLYTAADSLSLTKCTGDGTSDVTFPSGYSFTRRLEAGAYYVQLGVSGQMPNYHSVIIQEEADNDDLADAKLLTFPIGTIYEDSVSGGERPLVNGATMEHSVEPAVNAACPATLRYSVWYKFTLNTRQVITLSQGRPNTLVGVGFPNTPIDEPQYMDVWRKSGGLQASGCSITGKLVKTLEAGTYYLRIASPIKLHKQAPSNYLLAGKSEPVGLPTIIDEPDSNLYVAGETGQASIVVASDTPVSYQWYRGNAGNTSQPIEGATGSSYSTPLSYASIQWFWVRVTNAVGYRDSRSIYFSVEPAVTRTEVLDSGDFENGSSGWTVKNASDDKVRCGGLGHQSSCAFVFKGGTGENSVLKQAVPLEPINAVWGFSFKLRMQMKTKGHNAKLTTVIRVIYDSGNSSESFKLLSPATENYTLITESTLPNSFGGADSVTLTIKHKAPSGKTYIDKVELLQVSRQASMRNRGVLPPPESPEGFRGSN